MDKERLGKKLHALRASQGITQQEMAKRLGVTNRAVSKWEKGISSPTMDTLCKICVAFHVSPDSFLSGQETGLETAEQEKPMQTIRRLYRVGRGPSSTHTMGPETICALFQKQNPNADRFRVILYGSLAQTGVGHGTDVVIRKAFAPIPVEIEFDYLTDELPHPNTMRLYAYQGDKELDCRTASSTGGGEVWIEGISAEEQQNVYPLHSFREIAEHCREEKIRLWEYVGRTEGESVWEFLSDVWSCMKESIEAGLNTDGILPGGLHVTRRAKYLFHQRHIDETAETKENRIVCAYAFAVGEQNAAGGTVVTAPTCGASGVLPAVLYYYQQKKGFSDDEVLHALATASIVGNLIKTNASISGAECGCQAEIGSACSMAAAALGELLGLNIEQIEYAAEIAIEHHLGLTCDPIGGLVQIPCIERNAVAAMRAINAVNLANFLTDTRKISLDLVIRTMYETGKDLSKKYRETSGGGLAKLYQPKKGENKE